LVRLGRSRGKTRLFGWLALSIAAGFEIGRSFPGLTIHADVPGLRALYMLPFVWFALEAAKAHGSLARKGMS
jgi:hypothetical protein